ncbi:MAG TPA: MBL fold metallo-hydrolase [Acetobacteraceae bacterium]|nr:MBL fold metallo-hydrolase [Acetobacteraceae bacterium]
MNTSLATAGGIAIDILVTGYPGKSVCHGGLGWSTIALLRGAGRIALIDVGGFAQRSLLIDGLARHGLRPGDVTDVVLTHAHWDHAINWVLFPRAEVWIGDAELDWAVGQPDGETPVPELYVRALRDLDRCRLVRPRQTVPPGLLAHAAPGHTPGHLVFVLDMGRYDVIFTGDAAKNRAELLSRTADMTFDPAVSRASIEHIWALWHARPGSILVPGHDTPMRLDPAGMPVPLGPREAAIDAWFGDDLDSTTRFRLTSA